VDSGSNGASFWIIRIALCSSRLLVLYQSAVQFSKMSRQVHACNVALRIQQFSFNYEQANTHTTLMVGKCHSSDSTGQCVVTFISRWYPDKWLLVSAVWQALLNTPFWRNSVEIHAAATAVDGLTLAWTLNSLALVCRMNVAFEYKFINYFFG